MQKITCHKGKCIEKSEMQKAIDLECKDKICIDIENDLYGEI